MEAIKLLTPNNIKELDQKAINMGIPELLLMEDAAYGVFSAIKNLYKGYKVIIICGPGNNGGDGMALGRILKSAGWNVYFYFPFKTNYKGASLINYNISKDIEQIELSESSLSHNTLIVDALFGVGLNRNIEPEIAELINKVNKSKSKVLSIDIPSGINGLNGSVMGSAIKADTTVTLCAHKIGLHLYPGNSFCGKIILSEISIPKTLINALKTPQLNTLLPIKKKERESYKTSYGKVAIIAGSSNYYGAPYFASKASLLSGSGYTTLISEKNVNNTCAGLAPEVIYRDDIDLKKVISSTTTTVIGPGIGLNKRAERLFTETVSLNPDNLVIDGDALTMLAQNPEILENFTGLAILTPHYGEAAKLLDCSIESVKNNLLSCAKDLSRKYSATTVLKGAKTIISTIQGEIYINKTGSPVLGTAGSGDVLAGIIAGQLGLFKDITEAVRSSVYIHGLIGNILEDKLGSFGITAQDILNTLPEAINSCTSD